MIKFRYYLGRAIYWGRIIFVPWAAWYRVHKQAMSLWREATDRQAALCDSERKLASARMTIISLKSRVLELESYSQSLARKLDQMTADKINSTLLAKEGAVKAVASPNGGVAVNTPFGVVTHSHADPFRKIPPFNADQPSTWGKL